jgi:CRISPR-associated protein Csb2
MLAIEVEFLTGRYVATKRNDRATPEWPPHPSRLFSALTAALFEGEFDTAKSETLHEALEWLEHQAPPMISASHVSKRTSVASFVPVNGEEANDAYIKRGKKITVFAKVNEGIELRRNRQERYFPTVIPEAPRVVFCWPEANGDELQRHRTALERLALNVSYLGHSSSLVRVALCDAAPPTFRSAQQGEPVDHVLRVPGPGRLVSLEQAFSLSQEVKRRIEPPEGIFQTYTRVDRQVSVPVTSSVFDDRLIVFRRTAGRRLPLPAVLRLTDTVRRALIELADDPVPEVLSGHTADGGRSQSPHVAVVPLPNVNHRYADGTILGFAIVLPRALADPAQHAERRAVLRAVGRLTNDERKPVEERAKLYLGRAGVWHIERVTAESFDRKTLQAERYTQPSRRWATITPIVFGRFPKQLDSNEAHDMVREHCWMIGLPEPSRVEILSVSPILGTPPGSQFPTLSTAGKPVGPVFYKGRHRLPVAASNQPQPRLRVHVFIEFNQLVRGPVLLGAGRYLGMGFCLPLPN